MVMLAVDLLAWTQHLLLDGELGTAEPRTLRYRLLHRRPPDPRRATALAAPPTPLAWARELAAALPVPAG